MEIIPQIYISSKISFFSRLMRIIFGILSIIAIIFYYFNPNTHEIRIFGILIGNIAFYGDYFSLNGKLIRIRQIFFVNHFFNTDDIISVHKEYINTPSWIPLYRIKYYKSVNDQLVVKIVDLISIFFSNTDEFIEAIAKKT